jgi:hypothetical protein
MRRHDTSLSEIEIRTPYVVAERLIVALMLRFKPARNVLSDTLIPIHPSSSNTSQSIDVLPVATEELKLCGLALPH